MENGLECVKYIITQIFLHNILLNTICHLECGWFWIGNEGSLVL